MTDPLRLLREWRDANSDAAVVITIASTKGSVPRPTGTRMLVTPHHVIGTIGGGHLEWTAIDVARRQLAGGGGPDAQRFVLGASLGQCCGGVANVTFETISPPLDSGAADTIERWFVDSIASPDFPIVLFGAGHVGRALAIVLGQIPCSVTWVDSRDDAFPHDVASNIETIVTDAPEAEVDAAPAGTTFIVMTHAHALDETLAERILQRNDFAYLGLIGSKSKRKQFERRWVTRGMDTARFDRLTCPIGVRGIDGKEPGIIAVAVAAQVLREHALRVTATTQNANQNANCDTNRTIANRTIATRNQRA